MKKHIAVTVFTKLLLILASLGSSVITARALGVEERGLYFLVVSISALIVQFANLGVANGNVFYISKEPELLQRLVSNSLFISIGLGAVSSVIAFISIRVFGIWEKTDSVDLFLGIFAAPGALLYLFISNVFIAQHQYKEFNFFEIINKFLPLLFFLLVYLLGYKLREFLFVLLLATWIVPILMLREIGRIELSFDLAILKRMMPYSFLSYLACLGGYLILRASAFIGAELLTETELGLLSLAAQLADMVNIIPAAIIVVVFPYLIKGNTEINPLMLLGSVFLITAVICTCAYYLLPLLIPLLFGSEFNDASSLFNSYIPAILLFASISVLSHLIAAIRVPKTVVTVWGIGCIVCYLATPFMYEKAGVEGVIGALSASYLVVFLGLLSIYIFKIKRTQEIYS